jgi:hypothetical protein
MTDDEIRKLAEAATPGPWAPALCTGVSAIVKGERHEGCLDLATKVATTSEGARFEPVEGYWQMSERERHEADAAYIAAVSPDVMLALLDEKAALRKTLAWLQMALNWAVFCDHPQVGASNEMRDIRGRVDAALNPEVHE